MSPRTGRPPKENTKDVRIQVRLDKEDIYKLDECAKWKGLTRSGVIRKGIDIMYSDGKDKK